MSHPLTVPEGWVKGEALSVCGHGPRYALGIAFEFYDIGSYIERFPDGGFMITFDSKDDLNAFLAWWTAT